MKKTGLGRGLDALLPELEPEGDGVRQIPLNDIDRNPAQPRAAFDEEGLTALSESIRVSGVLMPLLVTDEGNGRYQIVAGERRFRAARLAGLSEVPCIVRRMTEQERMEAALVENLQREDLNPVEAAEGIRALMDKCGYTQEQAAARLGQSRPAVANTLRLLTLEKDILEDLRAGRLSAGHGRVLAGVKDGSLRRTLYARTLREKLSVRQLEALAADPAVKPAPRPSRQAGALPAELEDMRERLRGAVGIRSVLLKGSEKRGKVIFNYESPDELELIYAALEVLEGKN